MNEQRQRWVGTALPRFQKVIKAIEVLRPCANVSKSKGYEFTPDEAKAEIAAVREALADLERVFGITTDSAPAREETPTPTPIEGVIPALAQRIEQYRALPMSTLIEIMGASARVFTERRK